MPVKAGTSKNSSKLVLMAISVIGGFLVTLAWHLNPAHFADWEYAHLLTSNTSWDRLLANFQLGLQLPPLIVLIACTLLGAGVYYYCFSQLLTKTVTRKHLVVSSLVTFAITLALIALGNYRQQPSFAQLNDAKTLLRFTLKYLFLADFILALGIATQVFFQTTFIKLTSTQKQLTKIFLIALLLEVVVFNFQHHTSILYQPQPLTNPVAGENNLEFSDTNKYVITNSKSTFEFTDLNTHLDNICFDFHHTQPIHHPLRLKISATDSGFAWDYLNLPEKKLAVGYPATQCVRVHFSGITSKLIIKLVTENGTELGLKSITINQPVAFHFSLLRFLIVFAILTSFYFCHQHYPIWNLRLTSHTRREKIGKFSVVVLLLLGNLLIVTLATKENHQPWETTPHTPIINTMGRDFQYFQYQELAVALSQGKLDLGIAPDCLNNTSNPYDTTIRETACRGTTLRFDTAYYRPHYYVYFGVTPVVLLYLPYYLLTGLALPNWVVITIFSELMAIGVFYFFHHFIKRLFPRTPWLLYLLICELVIFSSGVGIFANNNIYLVPIIAVAACGMMGLALLENKRYFLGSCFLALVAGCRPQSLLFSLVVMLFYFFPLIKNKTLWQSANRSLLIKLAIPFIVVGSGLMAYNYARFASPFDFGANYNLTGFDMTRQVSVLAKLPPTLFRFLVQPPIFTPTFPFLEFGSNTTNYTGHLYIDGTPAGGIMFLSPWLWSFLLLFVPTIRYQLKKHRLFLLTVAFVIIGCVIAGLDAVVAGVAKRYYLDFAFILAVAASLIVLITYQVLSQPKYQFLRRYFLVALVGAGWWGILSYFLIYLQNKQEMNTYFWQALLQFWA